MIVLQDLYCVWIFFSHCKPSGPFAWLGTAQEESASPGCHLPGLLGRSGLEPCPTHA